MIRHGDANQKIRCIEGLEKMRAEERATKDDFPTTVGDLAAAIMKDGRPDGALMVMVAMFQAAKTLCGMPLPEKIYPTVNRHFPGLLVQLMHLLPENHAHHRASILTDAEKFIKADAMATPIVEAEANGDQHGNGAAQSAS